jgi:TolB-like protein
MVNAEGVVGMKHCPQCDRVETDDALVYCRVDGTALVSDSSSIGSEAGAVESLPSLSEVETSILPPRTDAQIDRETARTTVLPPPPTGATVELTKPNRRKVLSAVVMLVTAAIAIAIIGYFYYSRKSAAAIDSIAVLPFVNASGDPNTEYLSDGITESIINSLSQLPNLGVIARNSVFTYKGKNMDAPAVGRELKVRSVLTGRVVQRGDNLSISVELVDTANNHQLWGQQYDRKVADVFAVQEEIAKEITEKLRVKLSGTAAKRPTENLKAFQYYMQGRSYQQRSTREDLLTAIHYYEKAIEEDRNYALAYAGLADAYSILGNRGHIAPIEARRKAEEASRQALALDENLAEAHAAVGAAYVSAVPANFSLGDREFRRAIELSPSFAFAHQYLGLSLVRQGRLDEGLAEFVKGRELDPLSSVIARVEALPYYLKRNYGRALELLRQADELGPTFSTTFEIGVYIQNRLFNETLAELEKVKRDRKNDPLLIYDTGMIYAAQGKRAEALQVIKELEKMSGPSLSQAQYIAKIYATLNEQEQALTWLERGLATGAIPIFYKDDPVWDPIRSDPRFTELLRRMGIPQ